MTSHPTTFEISAEIEHTLVGVPLARARALDTGDADVLRSLLAEDVVVDLTPATAKIGLEFPVLSNKDTVIADMIGRQRPTPQMRRVRLAAALVLLIAGSFIWLIARGESK